MARTVSGLLTTISGLVDQSHRQPLHSDHHGGRVQYGGREHPLANPQRDVHYTLCQSHLLRYGTFAKQTETNKNYFGGKITFWMQLIFIGKRGVTLESC